MEDMVTAKADYSKLDAASTTSAAKTRIRLNSTVVQVRHVGGVATAKEVEVAYMRGEKLRSVTAKACVLACYNGMIPYLCPERPQKQRDALALPVKTPMLYTHVAICNWTLFQKLGVFQIDAPGSYHNYVALDFPVSLGDYKFPSKPADPAVLFMLRTPCKPGLPQREQNRAGRMELLRTPFSTFERNIREQLGRMLGAAGFDPAEDIEGITVNRWAQGLPFTTIRCSIPTGPKRKSPGCWDASSLAGLPSPTRMPGARSIRTQPSTRRTAQWGRFLAAELEALPHQSTPFRKNFNFHSRSPKRN